MNSERARKLAFLNSYISAEEASNKLKRVQNRAHKEGVRSQARNQQIRNLSRLRDTLNNQSKQLFRVAFPTAHDPNSHEIRQLVLGNFGKELVGSSYNSEITGLRKLLMAKLAANRFKEQLGRPRNDDLKKFQTRKHHELVHKKNKQALEVLYKRPVGKWLSGLPPEMQNEIARRFRWPSHNNNNNRWIYRH